MESLSTYAKQFLERMEKPHVDVVEGITPAVAIEQKNPTKTSRSTVGTATEVYDYLRLLWARVGPHALPGLRPRGEAGHGAVRDGRRARAAGGDADHGGVPARRSRAVHPRAWWSRTCARWASCACSRDEVAGPATPTTWTPARLGRDLTAARELLVVVDRLVVRPDGAERLADSLAPRSREGEGEAVVVVVAGAD